MSTPLTSRRCPISVIGGNNTPVISPQTRRAFQATSSGRSDFESPLPEVQNEEDVRLKKEKRRSRALVVSSGSPHARPVDDSHGETAKLTNDQLASHYVNCIKLSTENKITAKNAFNLHLIDHMNEMLKQRCEGALNFQMAGGTIFASAKIYASRVDAVHSETYKVMSSLGRGPNEEKEADPSQESEGGDRKETGRKKKKRSKILESNDSSLRMKKMDASYQTDPLDQYYSSVFDVASTSGLLINHLGLCKDGISVRFGSDSDMDCLMPYNVCGRKRPNETENPEAEEMEVDGAEDSGVNPEIVETFHELVKLSQLETVKKAIICPALAGFQWMGGDDSFEWHQDVTPDSAGSDSRADSQPESQSMFDDDEDTFEQGDLSFVSPTLIDHQSPEVGNKNAFPNVMDEELLMAFQPGEYSYFKPGAFSMWDGPNHWKTKLRNKVPSSVAATEKASRTDQPAKRSKRKRDFYIDYRGKSDMDEREFEKTSKSKDVSKRIREKWGKCLDDRLLPSAGEYNVPNLTNCILQPRMRIRPVSFIRNIPDQAPQVDSDKLGIYNYDNPNDKNNYCPNMGDDEEVDESAQADDIPANFACDYTSIGQGGEFPDVTLSQAQVQSQFDISAMLKGDHLISHPKKVEKVSIEYAKKATRIDVRRLKAAMWTVLHKNDPDRGAASSFSLAGEVPNNSSHGELGQQESKYDPNTFSTMYTTLPKLMPATMAENLSIPLAFTCLLHLANEKSLTIIAQPDMSDLCITEPVADV